MTGGWRRSDLFVRRALLVPSVMVLPMAKAIRAQEIRVAAAADLEFAMKDIAAQFEKQTGTEVDATYSMTKSKRNSSTVKTFRRPRSLCSPATRKRELWLCR
jgi:extracellular solute-binding protein